MSGQRLSRFARIAALVALVPLLATATTYRVLGWNDLGMHCLDADYSVFAILPPYNNLHAQVLDATHNKLVTSGVTVTFEATQDTHGSINTYSAGKTNFWAYTLPLLGVNLPLGIGLTGYGTASTTPQAMAFNASWSMFAAQGIPITPIDDNLQHNYYPMTLLVARDPTGAVLAQSKVVLPVSDEMTCVACHASGSDPAAMPTGGWVYDPRGVQQDFRRNVLALHDDRQLGLPLYRDALAKLGFNARGLLATADGGHPILCAACHASNALPGTGLTGINPMTQDVHTLHASVINPATGLPLDSKSDRTTCYMCHPGSTTQCLRGVMGNAKNPDGSLAIQCQSCHARMVNVGSAARVGWFDQPNCQACHHNGKRELSAVDAQGNLRHPKDPRYATTPNVPMAPYSLYRFSSGHGGLQCEACHGSTHAEWTSSEANDNVISIATQGHAGMMIECSACHQTPPLTATGGPHGIHTVGEAWVRGHGNYAQGHQATCSYCHGKDFRGTGLSSVKTARVFTKANGGSISYVTGQAVSCYDCHNGPNGGAAVARTSIAR